MFSRSCIFFLNYLSFLNYIQPASVQELVGSTHNLNVDYKTRWVVYAEIMSEQTDPGFGNPV